MEISSYYFFGAGANFGWLKISIRPLHYVAADPRSDCNQISKRSKRNLRYFAGLGPTGVDDSNAIVTSYPSGSRNVDAILRISSRTAFSRSACRATSASPAALSRANRSAIPRPGPCDAPVIRIHACKCRVRKLLAQRTQRTRRRDETIFSVPFAALGRGSYFSANLIPAFCTSR
jgi:hypothetical protein